MPQPTQPIPPAALALAETIGALQDLLERTQDAIASADYATVMSNLAALDQEVVVIKDAVSVLAFLRARGKMREAPKGGAR